MMSCATQRNSQRVQPWELDCLLHDGTWNSLDPHTRDIDHQTMRSRICATTGMSSTSEERNDFLNEQELWENNCLIHNLHVRNLYHRTTGISVNVCSNWGNVYGPTNSLDQEKKPLRHDGEIDDLDMHNNGHVNKRTKNGTCGISTVCTQTALIVPVSKQRAHQTCPRTAPVGSPRAGQGTVCTVRTCLCLPNRDRKLTQQVSTVIPNSAEYGNISGKYSQQTPHNWTPQATRRDKWLPGTMGPYAVRTSEKPSPQERRRWNKS